MNILCGTCRALLGPGTVYCMNCGTPVAASVETEPETVLQQPPAIRKPTGTGKGLLVLAIVIGFFFAIIGIIGYGLGKVLPVITSPTVGSTPAPTPTPLPVDHVHPTPMPYPSVFGKKAKPKPTRTPIDVDAMRKEFDRREAAANAMMEAQHAANMLRYRSRNGNQ
jgi:hypothetical protein